MEIRNCATCRYYGRDDICRGCNLYPREGERSVVEIRDTDWCPPRVWDSETRTYVQRVYSNTYIYGDEKKGEKND